MPDAVSVFWTLLALLAVAAACNHGWHHVRHAHLSSRLERVSRRAPEGAAPLARPAVTIVEIDTTSAG